LKEVSKKFLRSLKEIHKKYEKSEKEVIKEVYKKFSSEGHKKLIESMQNVCKKVVRVREKFLRST